MSTADGRSLVPSDPETRRALELDTLSAILPMDRRDRLAELLTDEDVATLTHLAREGMGANTLRALASDLAYLDHGKDSLQNFTQARRPGPTIGSGSVEGERHRRLAEVEDVVAEATDVLGLVRAQAGQGCVVHRIR